MALPVRSDGTQDYLNLSGYTGEATPESTDIKGAEFQKHTEATKAGLDFERAKKKRARIDKRARRAERKGKGAKATRLNMKSRDPINVGFGGNKRAVDVDAINTDPELQKGYRKAAAQGKLINQNNLEQGAELAVKIAAESTGTGSIPGILLNATAGSMDAGFKGEDAGKAFFTEGSKAYLGSDLFDQNMQSLKAAQTIKKAEKAGDVGGLLQGLEQAPGAAGEIVQGAGLQGNLNPQNAGLKIAGQSYKPSDIGKMAISAIEGNWQDPAKQIGKGFLQQGALPTNAFSITNPDVGKPSGPTYQPFDPRSMLTNLFQQS
jgi:hypothetical protein